MLRKSRKASAREHTSKNVFVDELENQVEEKYLREEVEKVRDLTLARQTINDLSRLNNTMSVSKARLINKIAGIDDRELTEANLDTYIDRARKQKKEIERMAELNRQRMLTEEEWHKTQLLARREILNTILLPVEERVKTQLVEFKAKIKVQNDALDREFKDLYQRGQSMKMQNDVQQMNSLIVSRKAFLPRSDDDFKLRRLYLSMDIYNRAGDEFNTRRNYAAESTPFYDCLPSRQTKVTDMDSLLNINSRRLNLLDDFERTTKNKDSSFAYMPYNDYYSKSTLF